MDSHDQYSNRGRSPSASVHSRNVSPSPHHSPYHDASSAGLMLDPSSLGATAATYSNLALPSSLTDSNAYGNNTFLAATPHTSSHPENLVAQNDQFSSSFAASFTDQIEQSAAHHEGNYSNLLNANPANYDFSQYAAADNTNFNPSLLLDPQQQQQSQQSAQGAQLMAHGDMASQMGSPHLLSPDNHSSPGNSHTSPPITSGPFYSPRQSRSASLDPMSAAFMGHPSQEWQGMLDNPAFQGHRRAPSEHSDVSSVSHHSPYAGQQESFEPLDGASPSLVAQNDPILYDNTLGMDSFTLSEQQQQQHQGLSPNHSPYISPQLPSQDLNNEGFILSGQQNMTQFPALAHDAYSGPQDDIVNMPAPNMAGVDMNQMSNMAPPPSINVEFAPPSRMSSFGPGNENDFDALSPPSRSRGRSKSDPFGQPAPRTHSLSLSPSPSPSPGGSVDVIVGSSSRSLSPFDRMRGSLSNPGSRSVSPASRSTRRQSTSSIERKAILDLADPQRPGATPSESKRTQKHPATFQCSLCPKRFTRAYNLRSHLRTHTDERPFVCSVCGKAFARQHDRKRHEGLHSGEKKFVCRGDLAGGGQWGCGRRFARADALGRHFRSEAGRACIKALLDEEAIERNRNYLEQQQQQQQQQQHLQPVQQAMMVPGIDNNQPGGGGFTLPAALLAQYPALQTIQWDQIAPTSTGDDPSDISGRNSFDASSGGEFGFDDDELSGSFNGSGGMYEQNFALNATDNNFTGHEWNQ